MKHDKGKAVFKLLLAHYANGNWSATPSNDVCASIAQQVGHGVTVKQVKKKVNNVKTRYCSSSGRLDYTSGAVKAVIK